MHAAQSSATIHCKDIRCIQNTTVVKTLTRGSQRWISKAVPASLRY